MAWDDTKSAGDTLTNTEYNSMVTDQKGHKTRHQNGGADEISIAGLDGEPTELTNFKNTSTGHDHDGTDSKKVTAANVINVAAGNIVATDVQAAINELDTEKSDTGHNHDATYAAIANGVTGGNSHDHNGGDGAQIDHVNLANIGTNTHAQIDTHIAATASAHGVSASGFEDKGNRNQANGYSQLVAAPAAADSAGTAGQIAYDADYLYVCVASNTWKRVAIATWP